MQDKEESFVSTTGAIVIGIIIGTTIMVLLDRFFPNIFG